MVLRNDNLHGSKESGKEDKLLGGEEYGDLPARSLTPSRSIVEDDEILGGRVGFEGGVKLLGVEE